MQSKVEADGAKEEQMYNKFACWCENSAKRKAAAIQSAQSEMRKLGQEILSLKGKVAVLTSEMEQLAEDMKENEKAQGKATAVRTKENKEYTKRLMRSRKQWLLWIGLSQYWLQGRRTR